MEMNVAKKKPTAPSQMDRVRAAVRYTNNIQNPEHAAEAEMHAFMAIFHPEMPRQKVQELAKDAGKRRGQGKP
jgi:hypothetical protein